MLKGARGIAIYESDDKRYAAVASYNDQGVQILDITYPDNIVAKGSIIDNSTLALAGASDITVYESGIKRYAAVASYTDSGVQILDITDPENIVPTDSITDVGTLELERAQGIAIYESGNKRYAAVVSVV